MLPECENPEQVSLAVQSLLDNGLEEDLLKLLSNLLLHCQKFLNFKKLQNLLIYTAMKVKKESVIEYISNLNNYDIEEIANALQRPEFQMYEEAF